MLLFENEEGPESIKGGMKKINLVVSRLAVGNDNRNSEVNIGNSSLRNNSRGRGRGIGLGSLKMNEL